MQFSVTKDKDGKERVEFSSAVKFEAVQDTAEGQAGGDRVLTGLAIVYGPLSSDRGGYKVRIAPGSAIYTDAVLAFINHNDDLLIGNTVNGSLSFSDQPEGIYVRIVLPANVDGDKAWVQARDGYSNGMSFGAIPLKWIDGLETIDGVQEKVRTYTKMLVDEVSLTPDPSFTGTFMVVSSDSTDSAEPEIVTPAVADATDDTDNGELDFCNYRSIEVMALQQRYLRLRQ